LAAIFRLLVIGGIAFVGISYVIYQLLNFKFSLFGSKRQLERDIESLRAILKQNQTELVDLDQEEIGLISKDLDSNLVHSRLNGNVHGLINSIYHEPLVTFAAKSYKGVERGVVVLNFNEFEFAYVKSSGNIKVYKNGKSFGNITRENELYLNERPNALAALVDDSSGLKAIMVAGLKVGNMHDVFHNDSGNQRAFSLLNLKDESQSEPFLILTLYELIRSRLN